jgi:hypothetical protein
MGLTESTRVRVTLSYKIYFSFYIGSYRSAYSAKPSLKPWVGWFVQNLTQVTGLYFLWFSANFLNFFIHFRFLAFAKRVTTCWRFKQKSLGFNRFCLLSYCFGTMENSGSVQQTENERRCQIDGCNDVTVGARTSLCRKHRNNKYKQNYKKKKRKAQGAEVRYNFMLNKSIINFPLVCGVSTILHEH